MELTIDAVSRVIHPTAAFTDPYEFPINSVPETTEEPIPWLESELNPKNRIDSLDEVCNPRWRIDGSSGMGTQFFTVPLFFTGRLVPIRVDTFIPESSKCPTSLLRILELGTAFHVKDARVARLGISRHILRTLEYWVSNNPSVEAMYNKLPFGSRIVFENLHADIRKIKIRIGQNHEMERLLLSCAELQSLWDIPALAWPEEVDISQVKLHHQPYDSVSFVQISTSRGPQNVVLKALTSYPKYLYHELKILLTLPTHPNIISRPLHIVTKRCLFGGRTAVIGFTMTYHQPGTLRDILPFRRMYGTLRVADQLKWAIQLTSALVHIHSHGRYYSDLRLDNILLSERDDLVLVDFEQRGVWCSFASPELNYLDYVFMLAADPITSAVVRERYRKLLELNIPGYEALLVDEYCNSEHGYSIPWSGLDSTEREAAVTYMLGRVLWCIFEGQSSPEIAVWQSYPFESDLEFPAYRNTPPRMRELIRQCTCGRESTASWYVGGTVRKGNQLVLREGNGTEGPQVVQSEATRWWNRELQEAENFLDSRLKNRREGNGRQPVHRLKLHAVLEILRDFQNTMKEG